MLIIKQCFKFLNAFSFSSKDKIVLSIRQGYEVLYSVVMFNSIEMMNYPTFRQWLTIGLFPYKQMLSDMIIKCSWMSRGINENISCFFLKSATLPLIVLLSCTTMPTTITSNSCQSFHVAMLTPCSSTVSRFTTIYTEVSRFSTRFTRTVDASLRLAPNAGFTAIYARILASFTNHPRLIIA